MAPKDNHYCLVVKPASVLCQLWVTCVKSMVPSMKSFPMRSSLMRREDKEKKNEAVKNERQRKDHFDDDK